MGKRTLGNLCGFHFHSAPQVPESFFQLRFMNAVSVTVGATANVLVLLVP